MTAESQSSLTVLKSQLEEFKEKSRKEITDSQKQAKDRGAEVEKMQFSMGRLQDEVWAMGERWCVVSPRTIPSIPPWAA